MAKKSVMARNHKRQATVKKYAKRRQELKKQVCDMSLSAEERFAAQCDLQALPRNASPIRVVNRCVKTGRARGVYSRFNLSRNMLRIEAMRGNVPGIVKSSW